MKDLLVFVTPKQLMAYDMTKRECISIDGQDSFKYVSNMETEKFCDYLKDGFNIDSFGEMDLAVTVVCCGGKIDFVEKLYGNLHGCKSINVIDVEKLLPMVADYFGVKKGEQKYFSVIDVVYHVRIDDVGKVIVEQCDQGNDIQKLQLKDFSFVCNYFLQSKWDEEKENQYSKLVQSEEKLRNTVGQLTTERKKSECKLDDVKRELASLRTENKKLKDQLSEKSLIGKRRILTIKEGDVPKNIVTLFGEFLPCSDSSKVVFVSDFMFKNGSVVKKGDTVAKVSALLDSDKKDLLAPADGRILFLRGKRDIAVGDDYAIICDPSDDVDNVMDWYKKLGRK